MSELTDFERGRIIGRWEAGESTRNIASALNRSQSQVTRSATVRNYLHEEGYYSRVALRKPFVSEKNRQKRLKWCKERKNWNTEWNYVIWSDESRYNLHQNDGRQRVCRLP